MKPELVVDNTAFMELNDQETMELDGGGVWVAIGVGAASYFAYSLADEGVKSATGRSIAQNGVYYAGKGLDAVGKGLKSVGNFLSK